MIYDVWHGGSVMSSYWFPLCGGARGLTSEGTGSTLQCAAAVNTQGRLLPATPSSRSAIPRADVDADAVWERPDSKSLPRMTQQGCVSPQD
ncbi:unnamed protein product [Arctogadus glacialis]